METLSLIDVSLEDDDVFISSGDQCLFDPPSPILQSEEPFQFEQSNRDVHFEEPNLQEESRSKVTDLNNEFPELSLSPKQKNNEFPELSLSPEQKRSKKESNVRKSLAWNSEFLTCEGVLNTEELAIINPKPSQNPSKTSLAGIPEETRRSGESSSTVDSEGFALEGLETELFNNVRASIQNSFRQEGLKGSKDQKGGSKGLKGIGATRFGPKEKVVSMRASSQNKIRPPTATGVRKTGLPPKLPESTSKHASISAKSSIGATNSESKANSSKPPRILPKSTNIPKTLIKVPAPLPSSLKRSSTGSVLNGPPMPKVNRIPSARSLITPPNNTNTNNTTTTNKNPPLRRTQSISIPNPNPNPKLKSPTPLSKKKPAPGPPKTPSSSSRGKTVNTPTKSLKQASSVSPHSSIDSLDFLLNGSIGSNGSPGSSLTGRASIRDPLSGGGLSRSSSNSSICSEDNGGNNRGFKPSCLRMPTPKIGYFDKEKSLSRNSIVEKENVHLNTSEAVPVVQHLEEKISSLSLSQ